MLRPRVAIPLQLAPAGQPGPPRLRRLRRLPATSTCSQTSEVGSHETPGTGPPRHRGAALGTSSLRRAARPSRPREPVTTGPAGPAPSPVLRDAYGSRTRGVEDLTLLVAQVLDVAFVFRDSYDHGEHYDYHGPGGEKIEVKQNAEDDDGELMEPAHPSTARSSTSRRALRRKRSRTRWPGSATSSWCAASWSGSRGGRRSHS